MNNFKVLCVFDVTRVLLKWNGNMLVKWALRAVLDMLFMSSFKWQMLKSLFQSM